MGLVFHRLFGLFQKPISWAARIIIILQRILNEKSTSLLIFIPTGGAFITGFLFFIRAIATLLNACTRFEIKRRQFYRSRSRARCCVAVEIKE